MTEKEIQLCIDYQDVFSSKQGKAVLADLDKQGRYRGDLFSVESERLTSFNLGGNSIVRYIHEKIDKDISKDSQEQAVHETII